MGDICFSEMEPFYNDFDDFKATYLCNDNIAGEFTLAKFEGILKNENDISASQLLDSVDVTDFNRDDFCNFNSNLISNTPSYAEVSASIEVPTQKDEEKCNRREIRRIKSKIKAQKLREKKKLKDKALEATLIELQTANDALKTKMKELTTQKETMFWLIPFILKSTKVELRHFLLTYAHFTQNDDTGLCEELGNVLRECIEAHPDRKFISGVLEELILDSCVEHHT